jgi:hypothetical protein
MTIDWKILGGAIWQFLSVVGSQIMAFIMLKTPISWGLIITALEKLLAAIAAAITPVINGLTTAS